jgi:hypothetical protein
MSATEIDIETWCDEMLPDLYDEGMFDYEEISEEVWEGVSQAMGFLEDAFSDEEERDSMEDTLIEAARDWFRAHHNLQLDLIAPLSADDIHDLCSRPQTAQHSADWYSQRRNRLTASEFNQILDGRRGALLRQKVAPVVEGAATDRPFASPVGIAQSDGDMNATTWGHRFESVVRDIYEQELAGPGSVNDSLGRFTHARIPWISASPDGIVTKGPLAGRLLEIKAPKTRQPGDFVPPEYYVQMQIQMEVCDVDVVDFVEAQFAQRPVAALTAEDKKAIKKASWKGRIEVRGTLENPTYRYTKAVEDLEDAIFPDETDAPLLEQTVWWLVGWYPRTVLRNKIWWHTIGWPNAELFWAEVLSLREVVPLKSTSDVIEHVGGGWMGQA